MTNFPAIVIVFLALVIDLLLDLFHQPLAFPFLPWRQLVAPALERIIAGPE